MIEIEIEIQGLLKQFLFYIWICLKCYNKILRYYIVNNISKVTWKLKWILRDISYKYIGCNINAIS